VSYRVRPARNGDFDAIYEMATLTGGGFTNLPRDKGALAAKLARSEAAFTSATGSPEGDLFVFMLENAETGEVRGTCQVFSRIGVEQPFYSYRISKLTQKSPELGRTFHTEMLTLCTDFNDCSEVGGLFLHPEARASGLGLGLLLARSRYLFIRRNRERFADIVVAELRGVIDAENNSPFWDAIAGRFFGMGFNEADAFNGMHGTQFIADLMPKTPIYTAMLSPEALAVMRKPHPNGEAAMQMLEREGFDSEGYIDIFDGGPTMSVKTDEIRTIEDALEFTLSDLSEEEGGEKMLVASGGLGDFVAAFAPVRAGADGAVTIHTADAALLGLKPGDSFLAVGR
jgi:arginine N-succinyltransferase